MRNKQLSASSELEELRGALADMPDGPAGDEIGNLLVSYWRECGLASVEKTTAEKVAHRMENLRWERPFLCFEIERHGAMACGSTRAEVHGWSINIDTGEASCGAVSHRQVRAMDKPLKVQPLVEKIAKLIQGGKRARELTWQSPSRVKLIISQVIPATNAQTTQGRRRRFSGVFEARMKSIGWHKVLHGSPHVYEKD